MLIADNVLDEQSLWVMQDHFEDVAYHQLRWIDGTLDEFMELKSPVSSILNVASRVFDLSGMSGVEQWAHDGTKTDWHIDMDEVLVRRTGEVATPICSIVFYASIESLIGGKFMTKDVAINPKTNRMIVFGPNIEHGVSDFTGTRVAVAINPWATKPQGYR